MLLSVAGPSTDNLENIVLFFIITDPSRSPDKDAISVLMSKKLSISMCCLSISGLSSLSTFFIPDDFAELGARLQNNVASRARASFSNSVASRAIAYFSTKKFASFTFRVIAYRVSKITSRCFRVRNFPACPPMGFLPAL